MLIPNSYVIHEMYFVEGITRKHKHCAYMTSLCTSGYVYVIYHKSGGATVNMCMLLSINTHT